MKQSTILILCMGLVAIPTSCRPEKTTGEGQGGARSLVGEHPSMASTPNIGMDRVVPMDFSLPPGDDGSGNDHSGNDHKTGSPGDLKAALAILDRVGARQRQVLKLWQAIHSVADAQQRKQAILKGALDVLALTISSMQKAVTLSKAGLAKFLDQQRAQRVHTRKMNETIKAKQRQLTALPGGQAFFEALKQSATVEVRKHSQTLMLLGRKLLKRKEELKR